MSLQSDIFLYFERVNPDSASNVVLIFLHEALGSIGQWRSFPERLCASTGHSGIVYERQGHGRSTPLTAKRNEKYLHDYAWKELPEFLSLIRELITGKRIVLIGHSDGGSIALLYASRYHDQIAAVITIAAHVINEQETIAGIEPAVQAFESGKLDGLFTYHSDKTNNLFYAWADTWRSESFSRWDITTEIEQRKIPVLALQGKEDQYGTELQLELIQQKTDARIEVIENCGHHPHLEKMEQVIDSIRTFMGTIQL